MFLALVALCLSAREIGMGRVKAEPRVVLGFLVLTCVYVSIVGTFCEYSENNRFKFVIEPFLIAAMIFAAQRGLEALRRKPPNEERSE